MRRMMAMSMVVALAACGENPSRPQAGSEKSAPRDSNQALNQRLILACFHLNADEVLHLLGAGADVNARYGGDSMVFQDKWSLGWPLAGAKWTPLIATVNSSRLPDPDSAVVNTVEGREDSRRRQAAIPPAAIEERDSRRLAIARILIERGAKLDLDDGYGATALYASCDNGFGAVALLLMEHGANINTKTRTYIDDPGNKTPLHAAVRRPAILKALLANGADVNAGAPDGGSPLFLAVALGYPESVALLIQAGARCDERDSTGRSMLDWVKDSTSPESKKIADMLRAAGAR